MAPGDDRARLRALLALPPAQAARGLIGCVLVRRLRGKQLEARIVEAEAYLGARDPAAHAHRGRTPRTEPLYGSPGTLYVYFVYGIHHCLNLAVDAAGRPGCVLIRAAEPLPSSGLEPLALRGPGRLCRALEIDTRLSGRHVFEAEAPLTLRLGSPLPRVAVSRRIGIRKAAARRLRFYDPESPAVSTGPGAGISFRRGRPRAARPRARPTAKRGTP